MTGSRTLLGYGHKCSVILPENQYLANLPKCHQQHPHFETDKFDGTNWSSWQRLIHTAAGRTHDAWTLGLLTPRANNCQIESQGLMSSDLSD